MSKYSATPPRKAIRLSHVGLLRYASLLTSLETVAKHLRFWCFLSFSSTTRIFTLVSRFRLPNGGVSETPNGFTLIEILLAITIFAVIITSLFSSYTGSLRMMRATEIQVDLYRKVRIALLRISDDLESTYYLPRQENSQEFNSPQFSGKNEMSLDMDADTLFFMSRAHITFSDEKAQVGVANISYYVEEADNALKLFRSDTPIYAIQPDEKSKGLVLCDEMAGINFTYYDSKGEAFDEWSLTDATHGKKLPNRVTVQIWLKGESEDTPLRTFSTSVVLPINGR